MQFAQLVVSSVDPQGEDALGLLREAAVEARSLYPDLQSATAPWPTNRPTPACGTYVVAYVEGKPVGCGALRPIDARTVEVRRMFVPNFARRRGVARSILATLEKQAAVFSYAVMRLETGYRQHPAMALYVSYGFARIAPFGEYVNDPTSVCYEKSVATASAV